MARRRSRSGQVEIVRNTDSVQFPSAATLCSATTKWVQVNARVFSTVDHSPLEGESQKPSRSLSLSKGRRWLMRRGDYNVIPYARCMINYVCILRRDLTVTANRRSVPILQREGHTRTKEIYDWVQWFRELAEGIAEGGKTFSSKVPEKLSGEERPRCSDLEMTRLMPFRFNVSTTSEYNS